MKKKIKPPKEPIYQELPNKKTILVHPSSPDVEFKTKRKYKQATKTVTIAPPHTRINPSEHWKGMPEFNAPGMIPIKKIIVNLYTKEDMHKFAKLMGQPVTAKTAFVNFPFIEEIPYIDKRWVNSKKK